ncbi:hypothetical protein THAOC_09605 [Thalassiosira oceanica]|uniref:Uncharacterized protein n=1 Tax=Thalassiosira oceanica TaxID=159749 RepID=K0SS95_THAOC|nr:hypothetical protein THAOC_09605 [Thalassiosira oceanica]|eukprot:EJK69168.1 hypothetical protein THAOC_09605 [Thalassiosira oceanica]
MDTGTRGAAAAEKGELSTASSDSELRDFGLSQQARRLCICSTVWMIKRSPGKFLDRDSESESGIIRSAM